VSLLANASRSKKDDSAGLRWALRTGPSNRFEVFCFLLTERSNHLWQDVRKFIAHRQKYAARAQYMFNPEFWCHVWDWVSRCTTLSPPYP
jgi:hypothetical protein